MCVLGELVMSNGSTAYDFPYLFWLSVQQFLFEFDNNGFGLWTLFTSYGDHIANSIFPAPIILWMSSVQLVLSEARVPTLASDITSWTLYSCWSKSCDCTSIKTRGGWLGWKIWYSRIHSVWLYLVLLFWYNYYSYYSFGMQSSFNPTSNSNHIPNTSLFLYISSS